MTSGQNPAQAAIEADVAQISADFVTLAGLFTDLQNLISTANGNGTPVSTASLDALVAQGLSVTQNYSSLVPAVDPTPTPDVPPVDPTPDPSDDPTPESSKKK